MNYDELKHIGQLINLIATHMLEHDDVYTAVSTLPQECFEYYEASNKGILEVCEGRREICGMPCR